MKRWIPSKKRIARRQGVAGRPRWVTSHRLKTTFLHLRLQPSQPRDDLLKRARDAADHPEVGVQHLGARLSHKGVGHPVVEPGTPARPGRQRPVAPRDALGLSVKLCALITEEM